jgi:Zn-dependent protease with chaperone function
MENIYPAGPQDAPDDLAQPSSIYKRRAWMAMASLVLFIALYIALAGWFCWTAYRTSVEVYVTGKFEYILIAICAAFLALFMLKALFFVQRGSAPDAIEVSSAEQPRLFEFLNRLADEAGAPRPARVFLSARVNAAVFYDLSILNLIFPSRKNLEIGLALVNVLTLSEIKAVLAHEFGHFAQRTMAIGSWVYIAHQIAAHIISKRDAFDRTLQMLSHTDIRIAWVGWVMSLVVWSIRSLMDSMLHLVLLAQRALSRQMEFQADLVAVSLTGSNELVHALHKLQAADEAWGRTLGFTKSEIRAMRIPHDLFAVQTRILEKVGKILDDDNYGKAPPVMSQHPEKHRVFKSSFAQPPQMWSTHPASADREENAKRIYLSAAHDERSAWLMFDRIALLKKSITEHLLGKTDALPASEAATMQSLDKQYDALQYDPRYRGAYLGRSIVRHTSQVKELYQGALHLQNVQQALAQLYAPQLGDDLNRLRDLVQERNSLVALRDKVYQATGGSIVFRGREITRRQLPAVIRDVLAEEDEVRTRVLAHDHQCRATHLAAAATLGGAWRKYLTGLIEVLHYTEHTLADLRDAQGLFSNVLAVVLADGKITKRERKRLVATANMLHGVLANIYAQKNELVLDPTLCKKLGESSWPLMLNDFNLNEASADNLQDWMKVIDGWVEFVANQLYRVSDAALEQLLLAEAWIENCVKTEKKPDGVPAASAVPADYPTLTPGSERKRQVRLGLWDSFQTASGFFPSLLRLLVAGIFVTGVLTLGSDVATKSQLTIYNGLDRVVYVTVGKQKLTLQPDMATDADDIPLGKPLTIETSTIQGDLIERFDPPQSAHVEHYVYNVASASPLVETTAVYGRGSKPPPRSYGAPRWSTSSVDYYFTEPPETVKTKGGSATRTALQGMHGRTPSEAMEMLTSNEVRAQVVLAHVEWDDPNSRRLSQWKELASSIGVDSPQK